jgi:hypothetical protein
MVARGLASCAGGTSAADDTVAFGECGHSDVFFFLDETDPHAVHVCLSNLTSFPLSFIGCTFCEAGVHGIPAGSDPDLLLAEQCALAR